MFKVGDLVWAPKNCELANSDYYWDLMEEGPYSVKEVLEETLDLCCRLGRPSQYVPIKFISPFTTKVDLDKFM